MTRGRSRGEFAQPRKRLLDNLCTVTVQPTVAMQSCEAPLELEFTLKPSTNKTCFDNFFLKSSASSSNGSALSLVAGAYIHVNLPPSASLGTVAAGQAIRL